MNHQSKIVIALTAVLVTSPVLMTTGSISAFANTNYYGTTISAQGTSVSTPQHIDAMDSGSPTAFLPLFYVNQALQQFGITGSWDGNTWTITTPQSMNVDLSSPQSGQQINSSTLSMAINGTTLQYAPRQVAVDPSGGSETTYLPIFYISQVLNRLGIQSSWNGVDWNITSGASDEQSLITNLNNANNALSAAIQTGQLTPSIYSSLTNRINALESRLNSGSEFHLVNDLQTVFSTTGSLLNQDPKADEQTENAYQIANASYLNTAEQVSALTNADSGYYQDSLSIIINGKTINAHAHKLTHNNETYVSLSDAENLVKQITGDVVGTVRVDNNGKLSSNQSWNGQVWNVAWSHTIANQLDGTNGNTTFEINGSEVLRTNVIITKVGGQNTSFVPIWTVQQVVDQLINTNAESNTFTGGTWNISYDPNQQYTTSGVGMGQTLTGSSTPATDVTGGFNWGN